VIDNIRRYPVRWMSGAMAVLSAVIAYLAAEHLASRTVLAWLGLISVILSGVLGQVTHSAVTPLADPKNSAGEPLVPADSAAAQ
jgi:hypothetical protein